jgi:UDP-N-acetylmuramate--alanine ligase
LARSFRKMKEHYHFIGIGGIGMGGLASLLLDQGFKVSGSDIKTNKITDTLKEKGAELFIGHSSQNVYGADFIVLSSAIDRNNVEWVEAQNKKISILQRAELLAKLMKGQIAITVAGAHGKTTTSSMIANALIQAELDPTTAIGGIINGHSSPARLGTGQYFVAEVDESDGSFLYFSPKYSVITNIDLEHIDLYSSWDDITKAYKKFINRTSKDGLILACGDDPRLLDLLRESGRNFKTYGLSLDNDIISSEMEIQDHGMSFCVTNNGENLGKVHLTIPGKHNAVNALACISLGLSLSIDFNIIRGSLEVYRGVQRRFQLKGKIDDIWLIDDYAHHPTEITATLDTAQCLNRNRIITVFQPHRYSRVQGLEQEFIRSLTGCDYLIITDIYAASESPIEGITAQRLSRKVQEITDKPVIYLTKEDIVEHLHEVMKPGDLVLTMGAGDINHVCEDIVESLKQSKPVGSTAR